MNKRKLRRGRAPYTVQSSVENQGRKIFFPQPGRWGGGREGGQLRITYKKGYEEGGEFLQYRKNYLAVHVDKGLLDLFRHGLRLTPVTVESVIFNNYNNSRLDRKLTVPIPEQELLPQLLVLLLQLLNLLLVLDLGRHELLLRGLQLPGEGGILLLLLLRPLPLCLQLAFLFRQKFVLLLELGRVLLDDLGLLLQQLRVGICVGQAEV